MTSRSLERKCRPLAEQVLQELQRRLGSERQQGELVVVRSLHPFRAGILGSEVDQEEDSTTGNRFRERRDEGLARAIDPVKVVDQHDERLLVAQGVSEPAQEGEQIALLGLRVHLRRRILGGGHTEKLEDDGHHVAKAFVEEQQRAGDLPSRLGALVLCGDSEVGAPELEDRQIGNRPSVRRAMALVDEDPARTTTLDELEAEAALTHARIGDNADDLPVPCDRLLERRLENRHLALAADELGEAARMGDIEAGPHPPHTLELEDVQ
jgi:hypothetical protein